jgi:hypothetical protein
LDERIGKRIAEYMLEKGADPETELTIDYAGGAKQWEGKAGEFMDKYATGNKDRLKMADKMNEVRKNIVQYTKEAVDRLFEEIELNEEDKSAMLEELEALEVVIEGESERRNLVNAVEMVVGDYQEAEVIVDDAMAGPLSAKTEDGMNLKKHAGEEDEGPEFGIEDDDYVIGDNDRGNGYYCHALRKAMDDWDEMIQAISDDMEKKKFWPNVWFINERGNTDLLALSRDDKGKASSRIVES